MTRLALTLTPSHAHAVVYSAWSDRPRETFSLGFDPASPEMLVAALHQRGLAPSELYVAIALPLLYLAKVTLPPAPNEAREAMVRLEPERFFPVAEPVRASLAPDSDIAFAANGILLDSLARSLRTLAPVARLEPAPLAVAALTQNGTGTYRLGESDEDGAMDMRDGRLIAVRRSAQAAATPGAPVALPYIAALGAARRLDVPLVGSFLTEQERASQGRRTLRGTLTALVAATAAITLCFFAIDRSRERTLTAIERQATALADSAQPALVAQQQLALSQRERQLAAQTLGTRPNPSAALARISQLLPRDVVVLTAKATGNDWQIDGTARNAAALVPLLDRDPQIENVRSLAASSRFRDGQLTRESFSIALRVRHTP